MAPMPAEMLEGPGSVPMRPPSDVFGPRESLGLPISSGGLDLGSLPTPGSSLGCAAGHTVSHAFTNKQNLAWGTSCQTSMLGCDSQARMPCQEPKVSATTDPAVSRAALKRRGEGGWCLC